MPLKTYVFLLLFLVLFSFPSKVLAVDVVINEIFANPVNENDEFVELFNNADTDVDISDWKLSDKVKTYNILSTTISAKGFLSLKKSITTLELNNSNEELTLKDASDNVKDSFSYTSTIEGKSWSRHPDGNSSFYNGIDPTEGSENSGPSPTMTPIPTEAPTPAKIPTSTNSPVPTKSSTPTKVPTSTPTPTKKPTNTPTPKKEVEVVLGAKTKNTPTPTPDNSKNEEERIAGTSSVNPTHVLFILIGGVFLVGCGILAWQKFGPLRPKRGFFDE